MLVGDDLAKMNEAEKLARKHLGCQIFRTFPYFRKEGHVQVSTRSLSCLPPLLNGQGTGVARCRFCQEHLSPFWACCVKGTPHTVRLGPSVYRMREDFCDMDPSAAPATDACSAVAAQYHFNAQDFERRCSGTLAFLADIELLARTDYAVLTFNSGLAHLVDVLRVALHGKHRSTLVDASNARCAPDAAADATRMHRTDSWAPHAKLPATRTG